MPTPTSLRRKIWSAYILQLAMISIATVAGIYGASVVLKDVLIQRALVDEAAHYSARLDADPDAPLPDTYNLLGYLPAREGADSLPPNLRDLRPGFHALTGDEGGALVFVEDGRHGRLVLVFAQERVAALAFYFGAVPLAIVLILIYVVGWTTYRISRRAVSPVIWLAGLVQSWDPKRPDVSALDPAVLPVDVEGEAQVLAVALHDFACRIDQFVERERNFTRDASHELRSPLTVIRIACDMLLAETDVPAHALRTIQRIKSSARDMEALIESFLILAREGDTGLPEADFDVNALVQEECEKAEPLLDGRPITLRIEEHARIAVHGPPRVLSVILSNLLRNACHYTERGSVTVRIQPGRLEVVDTGVGMDADELAQAFEPFFRANEDRGDGQGVGLTIVRRLSERFDWPVTLASTKGEGTVATVHFPRWHHEPQ